MTPCTSFSLISDADLERLYEQWEEDEEPLEPDELPEWDPRRPQPTIDFSKLDMSDTDNVMRATKKGKTVMMFVKVSGKPTPKETEDITSIWQTGLWNTHISADRFQLEDDRVIFVFKVSDSFLASVHSNLIIYDCEGWRPRMGGARVLLGAGAVLRRATRVEDLLREALSRV